MLVGMLNPVSNETLLRMSARGITAFPIREACKAKTVIVNQRSMAGGYAKKVIEDMLKAAA